MVSFPNPRSRHPYHMHDMIRGQPAFVRETLERVGASSARGFLGAPRRLVVTGCGTSFHAAMYGARILQIALGSRCTVDATHAYDLLYAQGPPAGATVLGVSHSGTTSTTNQALARARRSGSRVLGLCGLPGTPMEAVAEDVLVIGSVHDHSWANTMSYTTQLTAFAALARDVAVGDADLSTAALDSVPGLLERALRCEDAIRALSKQLVRRERVTFLGSGLDEVTAFEAALKIRETCSFPASGYHPEQFLHGPFLSLDRREAVLALRSRDDGARARTILAGLADTGASVTTIGEGRGADVRLPATHRILRPILSVVPLQFVAYYAALEREANPDVMRSGIRRYRRGLDSLFA